MKRKEPPSLELAVHAAGVPLGVEAWLKMQTVTWISSSSRPSTPELFLSNVATPTTNALLVHANRCCSPGPVGGTGHKCDLSCHAFPQLLRADHLLGLCLQMRPSQ